MKTDKEIAELMDYLYGEMSDHDKEVFEEKLANDPELQAELTQLRGTQQILGQHTEVNPSQPLVISPMFNTQKSNDMLWRKWAGVAASLLVVLIAAAWWNLNITVGEGVVSISFNKAQHEELQDEKLAIEKNLAQQRAQLERYLENSIVALQDSLDGQFFLRKDQLNKITSEKKADTNNPVSNFISKEELALLLSALSQEQAENTTRIINTSAENQQQYMENLVAEMLSYMEAKRQSDLELINYALNEMQIRSATKQEQTEIVLAKLLQKWENK